tara:strand:- start:255 stop:1160 length:906 start_codon:yes stop_codon:yes gene_type:complete
MPKANPIKDNQLSHLVTQIIDLMETSPATWTKPWANTEFRSVDGHVFTGLNVLLCAFSGYGSHVFGTYRQWQKVGGHITQKSRLYLRNPRPIRDKETEEITGMLFNSKAYWNLEQVEFDNPADKQAIVAEDFEGPNLVTDITEVDTFVTNTRLSIEEASQAFYKPDSDTIGMPKKEVFKDTKLGKATDHYYCTLFHEMGHATGHTSRLNRLAFMNKDKLTERQERRQMYAYEELVAELSSVFLATELGVISSPRADHAAYLKSWMTLLKEDNEALVNAAADAQKAANYLINLQPKQIKKAA